MADPLLKDLKGIPPNDPFLQEPRRNSLDDIIEEAQQDLELERKRQESIITSEEPDKVLSGLSKVEKQIENEPVEVQRSVLDKAYNPGYFDRGVRGGNINRPTQQENKPLVKPGLNPGEVGQWQGFINAIKSGLKQGKQARAVIGLEGGLEAEERLKEIASLQAEIRGIPRSKAYNEFNDPKKTFGQSLKRLALDPIEIVSQLVVESMASFFPTQVAGMMTGAGIGAGVGSIVPGIGTVAGFGSGLLYGGITSAGLTSLGMEYSGKMLEVMEELGVNTEDPNDLERGFSDNTIMSEARELGLRKGVPIAIFDLVSAGVAGRFSKPGRTLAEKFIQGSKEVGTQAVLGSSGEAVGQLSAGEEIQPSAIIAEGIAEIGQSAPSGATRIATQRFKTQKQERVKAKGIEALESGQLRELSDQEITDFASSLTPEERMEVGIGEDGKFEIGSDLGKEVVRRNLDMDKFPETEKEIREANARLNIKERQLEGTDFTGALISKVEELTNIEVEREYLGKTLADEAEEQGWTEAETKQVLKEHGLDENSDPSEVDLTGTSFGGSIKISTAGTPERMAQEYVAVQEEMAEEYYKAEQQNNSNFDNEIEQERKAYHESTGEQDTGESNIEWFSTKAVHFATQGKVHESIGAKLRDIFKRFIDTSKQILKDAIKLRRAIKEGKVPESLVSKLKEATDFKTVGKKVDQAKKIKQVAKIEGRKATPDGGVTYRISEVGKVDPVGVFVIGADMVARDLDGKLNPFGLRYTENYNGFALSKAGATKLVKNGQKGFNTVAVIAYDKIKESQIANPSFQNRVKEKLVEAIGKRKLNKLLKENNDNVKKVSGIVNKEIQEANKGKAKKDKKEKINMEAIALDNAEPDSPQLRRKIIYVGTLKEIRTGEDRFRKHDVYPAEQIFDTLVELKEPIPIDDLVSNLPDTDFRKKGWGMMVTQTNFMMTAEESNVAKQLIDIGQEGKDVFTGTPNPDYQFFSSETDQTLTAEEAISRSGDEREFKSRQFVSQLDEQLGLGTATRGAVGLTEKYGNEPSLVTRFFGKQDPELLNYRGALIGLMFDQENVTNFIGDENGENSLIKITIDKTDLSDLNLVLTARNIPSKTVRIRGNQQDIFIWNFNDIDVNYVLGIAEHYNAKEQTEQRGRFENLTTTEVRSEARQRYIEIIQDYQAKTNASIPKAFTKFLPDFFSRKADRDKLQKQLKAKPKATYRLTPTFYSQAERTVTDKFPPTMKSQSVENFLKKNQVKPEEIEWLDLESLLKGKQKVTKEELQEWIQANKIEIKDVTLGVSYTLDEEKSLSKDEFIKMFEQPDPAYPDETPENALDDGETLEFVKDDIYNDFKYYKNEDKEYISYRDRDTNRNSITVQRIETDEYMGYKSLSGILERGVATEDAVKQIIGSVSSEATQYSSYQLPGEKEDYRELLLTLPKSEDDFKTSHFKQSNILAHVRFNSRISPTGERILFIEEVQSDWHSEGRSRGYKSRIITKLPEGYTVEKRLGTQYRVLDPNGERFTSDFLSEEFAVKHAIEKLRKIGVPNAPFKNNGWIELIMKRMLRHASDNNFDRIAWTTSNQQIDRWKNDLRQNVDQIQWQKHNSDVYYASTDSFVYDNVIINGLKKNENVFNRTIPIEGETTINGQRVTLEGLLGKQMATQIRNDKKRTGIIEGDDLTIGGQGFKVVYDFAISKILNKMGKKFGAKVDQVDIIEAKKDTWEDGKDITPEQKLAMALPGYDWSIKRKSAIASMITQPSIKITRKMKESALKGQPTFRLSKMSSTDEVLESSSFKKWFKGSKVVDKQGKPLVVYHGTTEKVDFKSFNKFSFFSTMSSDAERYTETDLYGKDAKPRIIPVYLSIKKPLDLISIGDITKDFQVKSFLDKLSKINKNFSNIKLNDMYEGEPTYYALFDFDNYPNKEYDTIYEYAEKLGYDGIKLIENGIINYQVFEPTQVKSVFNKGTFNPNDPRISFRLSPKNIVTPLAKVYQEQKGNKKSYTKKDWEQDLARLGYDEDMIKSAMDMFGIIRMKQIDTTDPTPIEKELKKLQEREIKKSEIKSRIKRAYRLGATEKEKEITKLQKIVTNYARENLPKGLYQKSEVTGILAKVRDAKRFRELGTAMERIDRVIDKVSKRGALAKWNKTIKKKATVKKVGGIPKGQVGADVQEIVNDIKSVYKLSEAEVESELEILLDVIDKSTDGQPTDLQSMRMHNLMTYGSIKSKTPEQIANATQDFDILVTQGRMQIIEETQAYKERMASVRAEILDVITGGAGAQTQQGEQALGLKPKDWSQFRNMLSQFDNMSQSLEYIFDKLSKLDKTSRPLQSFINNYFMPQIRQARLAEYGGTTEMITMMKNKLEEIYGLKGGKLRRKLNENIEKTVTITHHDQISPEGIKGDIVESTLTYNQAYKKWMELKDPTLHKTFVKMGWDVNKVINQIEQQLPKKVLAWAEWQLYEFYPMYYQRVNETFRRRFFVNLPFNPMYSPIKRSIGAKSDTADPTLDKKKTPFGSVQNGSMKSRVGSQEELIWVDGDTVLLSHISEMEHFIAYTDVLRELRSVFMSRDISRSIQQFHGKPISRVLNKFMDDIARGGIDKSNSVEGIDYLRGNFSRSAIGLNPVVFLKQLGSIPAYASDMPMSYWLAQFTLLSNPIEVKRMLKTLSESKLLDMRYEVGMERDIALAMRSVKPGNVFTGTDMLNNIAYLLTKLGDKTAIYLGGWPLYKYEYKQAKKNGATDKEAKKIAMKKFEASTLRAQQSGEIEDLADVQRSGTYAKLFTMFMTSPNQYYRMAIGGYRNLYHGRGSKIENLRRIFVAQVVLPTLFTFISNGFEYDEEDHITSLILFPFAGIMFFGQAYATIIDRLGGKNYGSAGEVSILEPFNDMARLASRIRQIQLGKKELDSKQVIAMTNDIIIAMSRILGLPYAGVKRSVLGAIKVVKGEAVNPIRETIGFKPKKKEKKKPKRVTAEPTFSQ